MSKLSGLGLFALAFALIGIFVWIPTGVETGYLEKVRRSITIGDALAPAVAFAVIGLGGLLLLLEHAFSARSSTSSKSQPLPSTRSHFLFSLQLTLLLTVYLVLLRYAGPLLTEIAIAETPYRLLRDTSPWKYIGFVLSGVFLVSLLSCWMTGQLRLRFVFAGLLICFLIVALYDLPFDDLLLPPNRDV